MGIKTASVRKLFPVTRKVNYLFNGGYCLAGTPVVAAAKEFLAETENGFNAENWNKWTKNVSDAYALFADLIGADAEEIASIPNTSVGTGLVAHMIDPKPGQNVVLDDLEYQTVFPFTIRQKDGVRMRIVRSKDGRANIDKMRAAVDDKTSAIVVSSVSCWNGYRYHLKELSEVARKHHAYLVVDGAQEAGAHKLDVDRDGVDFLATATHKWLLGLPGSGFLYVRKEHITKFDPPLPGWLSAAKPFDQEVWKLEFPQTAQRFESGMQNLLLLAAVKASLKLIHSLGIANIEQAILERTGYLIEKLKDIGVTVFTPEEKEHRAGLVAFLLKNHEALHNALSKNSIVTFHHPDSVARDLGWRTGGLRADPTFFNTWDELDQLLGYVKKFS